MKPRTANIAKPEIRLTPLFKTDKNMQSLKDKNKIFDAQNAYEFKLLEIILLSSAHFQ